MTISNDILLKKEVIMKKLLLFLLLLSNGLVLAESRSQIQACLNNCNGNSSCMNNCFDGGLGGG